MNSRMQRIVVYKAGNFELHLAVAAQSLVMPADAAEAARIEQSMITAVDHVAGLGHGYAGSSVLLQKVMDVRQGGLAVNIPSPGCERSGSETAAAFVSTGMAVERRRFMVLGLHTPGGLLGCVAACGPQDAEPFTRTAYNFIRARRGTFADADAIGVDPTQPLNRKEQ